MKYKNSNTLYAGFFDMGICDMKYKIYGKKKNEHGSIRNRLPFERDEK